MFTVDDYFKMFEFLRLNPTAHERFKESEPEYIDATLAVEASLNFNDASINKYDLNQIQSVLSSKKDSELFFNNVLDQPPFITSDFEKLRRYIIDWYSSNKSFIEIMRKSSDAFSLTNDHLDKAIQGFGANLFNKTTIPDRYTRVIILYALCELYKIKGSPHSIYQALELSGFKNITIREWWLEKIPNMNELIFRGSAIDKGYYYDEDANQYLPVDNKTHQPTYLFFEQFKNIASRRGDPHWFYEKDEILNHHNDKTNYLKLPSLTPYFSVSVPINLNRYNQAISMAERMLGDQYLKFLNGEEILNSVIVKNYDTPLSILNVYLGMLYTQTRSFNEQLYDNLSEFLKINNIILPSDTFRYPYKYEQLMLWVLDNVSPAIYNTYQNVLPLQYGSTNELKRFWEVFMGRDWANVPLEFFTVFGYIDDVIDYSLEDKLFYKGDQKNDNDELEYYDIITELDKLLYKTKYTRSNDWQKYRGYHVQTTENNPYSGSLPQLELIQSNYNNLLFTDSDLRIHKHDGYRLLTTDPGEIGSWKVDSEYFYRKINGSWGRIHSSYKWNTGLIQENDYGLKDSMIVDVENSLAYFCYRDNRYLRFSIESSWIPRPEEIYPDSFGTKGDLKLIKSRFQNPDSISHIYFCYHENKWIRSECEMEWNENHRQSIVNHNFEYKGKRITNKIIEYHANVNDEELLVFKANPSIEYGYQRPGIDYNVIGNNQIEFVSDLEEETSVWFFSESPSAMFSKQMYQKTLISEPGIFQYQLDRNILYDIIIFHGSNILKKDDDYLLTGNQVTFTFQTTTNLHIVYTGSDDDSQENVSPFYCKLISENLTLVNPRKDITTYGSKFDNDITYSMIFSDGKYQVLDIDYKIIGSKIRFNNDVSGSDIVSIRLSESIIEKNITVPLSKLNDSERLLRGTVPVDVIAFHQVSINPNLSDDVHDSIQLSMIQNPYHRQIVSIGNPDNKNFYIRIGDEWKRHFNPLSLIQLSDLIDNYPGKTVFVRDIGNGSSSIYEYQEIGEQDNLPVFGWLPSLKTINNINLGVNNRFIEWIDEQIYRYGSKEIAKDLLREFSTYMSGKMRNLNINISDIFNEAKLSDFFFDVINFFKPKRVRLLFYAIIIDIDDRLFNSILLDDLFTTGAITEKSNDFIRGNLQNFDGRDHTKNLYQFNGINNDIYLRYRPIANNEIFLLNDTELQTNQYSISYVSDLDCYKFTLGVDITTTNDDFLYVNFQGINDRLNDYVTTSGIIKRQPNDVMPYKIYEAGIHSVIIEPVDATRGIHFYVFGESLLTIKDIEIIDISDPVSANNDIFSNNDNNWFFKGGFYKSGNELICGRITPDGIVPTFYGEAYYRFKDPDTFNGTETHDFIDFNGGTTGTPRKYEIRFTVESYKHSYLTLEFGGVSALETDQNKIDLIAKIEQTYCKGLPPYHFDYTTIYDSVDIEITDLVSPNAINYDTLPLTYESDDLIYDSTNGFE